MLFRRRESQPSRPQRRGRQNEPGLCDVAAVNKQMDNLWFDVSDDEISYGFNLEYIRLTLSLGAAKSRRINADLQ